MQPPLGISPSPPEGAGHLEEEEAPALRLNPPFAPSSYSAHGKTALSSRCCGPGTLTSSASLVMGYFSRLEMTSSTATMFRICKTRAAHHATAHHAPSLLPIPARSASPSPRASGAGNTKAPTPHNLLPHLGTAWHLVLTLLSMYTPPAHVAVTQLKLMTVMKQDLLLIRETGDILYSAI